MVITEVRIKLVEENNERLQAFCSVTFDNAFVVRDLKIIEGTKGSFVAMPSRKLTDRCHCGCKNHLRARHCNQCGARFDENRALREAGGRAKLHADIAHPINSACREYIQSAIIKAFQEEKERSKQPGYVCRYDDYDAEYEAESYTQIVSEMTAARKAASAAEGYRTDSAHGTQGAHAPAPQETQPAAQGGQRGFGSGII